MKTFILTEHPAQTSYDNLETIKLKTNPLQLTLFINDLINLSHVGKVQRLSLQGNQLQDLSSSIIYLHQLSALNCDDNQLGMTVLSQFFDLLHQQLQQRGIRHEFSGTTFFRKCWSYFLGLRTVQNLQELSIRNNQLSMLPTSLCNIDSLVKLQLDGNQLTQLPGELTQLKALEILSLASNRLTKFPNQFTALENLRELNVADNELYELPNPICGLSSLTDLDCHENSLRIFPKDLHTLTNLRRINASCNAISSLSSDLFDKSKSLEILILNSNYIYEFPALTVRNNKLRELNIADNQLSSLPSSFVNLEELRTLSLPRHARFILNSESEFQTMFERTLNVESERRFQYVPLNVSTFKSTFQQRWFEQSNIILANTVYALKKRIHRMYLSVKLAKLVNVLDAGTRQFWGEEQLHQCLAKLIEKLVVSDKNTEVRKLGVISDYCQYLCRQKPWAQTHNPRKEKELLFAPYQIYVAQLTRENQENTRNNYQSFNVAALRGLYENIDRQHPKIKLRCTPDNFLTVVSYIHAIEYLDLSDNAFDYIPAAVFLLAKLIELRLSNNKIMQVQDSICNLFKLKYLYIDQNQLCELPENLFRKMTLDILDVSNNQLLTLPRIPNASKHIRIKFTGNPLTYLPNDIITIHCLMNNLRQSEDKLNMLNIPWCIDHLLVAFSKKSLSKLFAVSYIEEAMKTKKSILAIEKVLARLLGLQSIIGTDCKKTVVADPEGLSDMVVDHFYLDRSIPAAQQCKQYSLAFFKRATLYSPRKHLEQVHEIFFEPRGIQYQLN